MPAPPGPTTTQFYRSADGTLGPGAVLLQSIATPMIAPDETVAVKHTLMLPPGTYYLIVFVDAEGAVGEVTEKNNVRRVRKTVP